ncbi:MAG: CAP domain-containing protein [Candidatus Pacebacteria bacterium]|nr:CAP domain-containing protein [Candidatus Paceibacterota bacterium]
MKIGSVIYHLFHPQRSNNHRPRVLHSKAFSYLSLVALGFVGLLNGLMSGSSNLGYVLGYASSITPSQVVALTNAERARAGLAPLTVNSKLTSAALSKGQDMFNDQYWAHIAPDGKEPWSFIGESGYTYRVAGENLARDFSNSTDMMGAWMRSPTHKANIVNTRYQEIGIAVIDGVLGGHETTLVVQMFGTPQQVAAVVTPTAPKPEIVPQVEGVDDVVVEPPVNEEKFSTFVLEAEELSFYEPSVLSSALIPQGEFIIPPLFSALQLTKAFFLAMIIMIVLTLVYDAFIIGHRNTTRMVGKNLAHIIFLVGVSFLLIFFKGGIVG